MNVQPQNSVTIRDAVTRDVLAVVHVGSRASMDYGTPEKAKIGDMLRLDWGSLTDWASRQPNSQIQREVIIADEYVY